MTGEGEDGGVVYCEMQGTENTGETKTHLQMIRCAGIPPATPKISRAFLVDIDKLCERVPVRFKIDVVVMII
jgi:hypothetical protein